MKRIALIGCLALVSCRNCDDKPAPPEPVVATFDAAAPPKTTQRQAPSDGGPQPATKLEIRQRRAYLLALDKGRKATVAKDWSTAIASFDEAVKADRHDARAYAERAYAQLLGGGDLAAASADLDHASALTKDPKLLSQIWFNRGLVDEKNGDEKGALFDFRIANDLAPSAAAQKKLAGKAVCAARVVTKGLAPIRSRNLVKAHDWFSLARATGGGEDPQERPQDEGQARRALTGMDVEPPLPRLVTRGEAGRGREVFLVAKDGGGLRATYVGGDWGGRCPGEVDFEIAGTRGPMVLVHGRELGENGYSYMCFFDDGDSHPCAADDFEKPGVVTQSFCAGGTATVRDVVVDTTNGNAALVLERPEIQGAPPVVAKLQENGVALSGGGCDGVLPIAAANGEPP